MTTEPLRVRRMHGKWHVFNGICQIAGPYDTEDQAISVKRGIIADSREEEPEWSYVVVPENEISENSRGNCI